MPVNDTTSNRGYQKPNIANTLADDVGRLRSALDSIDADMASKAPVGAGGAIIENTNTISSNYTLTSGSNGISAGPVTINSGVTVTVPSGSSWIIV